MEKTKQDLEAERFRLQLSLKNVKQEIDDLKTKEILCRLNTEGETYFKDVYGFKNTTYYKYHNMNKKNMVCYKDYLQIVTDNSSVNIQYVKNQYVRLSYLYIRNQAEEITKEEYEKALSKYINKEVL